jgi:hypothetical protein
VRIGTFPSQGLPNNSAPSATKNITLHLNKERGVPKKKKTPRLILKKKMHLSVVVSHSQVKSL